MAVATGSSLELADAFRCGRSTASPRALWRAANDEAEGKQTARTVLFRHAMIHAGYLQTARGTRYKRCPMCRVALT